jgi:hypothetical protein
MPQEVVVNKWCDPCWKDDQRNVGHEVALGISEFRNGKPYVVLMCDLHQKEYTEQYIQPILDLLEEFGDAVQPGRRPAPARPKEEGEISGLTCSVCGDVRPSRHALGQHAKRDHNVTVTTVLREPVEFVCKNCPADLPPQEYGSGTGFSAHRRTVHGLGVEEPLLPGENLVDDREFLSSPKPGRKRGDTAA